MATLRDWAVLALFLAYATPFFWQLLTSLKPEAELMVLPPLLPTRLTWEHYRVVLGQSVMLRALINSLGVGAITTALALCLGLFGAYGIARYPVPGKGLLLRSSAAPFPDRDEPAHLLMRSGATRLALITTRSALPLVICSSRDRIPAQLRRRFSVDGAAARGHSAGSSCRRWRPGSRRPRYLSLLLERAPLRVHVYRHRNSRTSRWRWRCSGRVRGAVGDIAAASMLAERRPSPSSLAAAPPGLRLHRGGASRRPPVASRLARIRTRRKTRSLSLDVVS
jgi:hypothetical protein